MYNARRGVMDEVLQGSPEVQGLAVSREIEVYAGNLAEFRLDGIGRSLEDHRHDSDRPETLGVRPDERSERTDQARKANGWMTLSGTLVELSCRTSADVQKSSTCLRSASAVSLS